MELESGFHKREPENEQSSLKQAIELLQNKVEVVLHCVLHQPEQVAELLLLFHYEGCLL